MDQNPILLPFFSSKYFVLIPMFIPKNHGVIGFQCYPHHSSVLTCAYSDAPKNISDMGPGFAQQKPTKKLRTCQDISGPA
jgi:hypothetical protein